MLIGNNSNDLKTYKLIESINLLLKKDILSPKNGIDFLINLLPYSLHPNTLIHSEIFDLIKNLLNFLNSGDIYLTVKNAFLPYFKLPFFPLDFDTINNNYLKNVNRCYYMIKLNQIDFNFQNNSENNKDISKIPPFSLIEDIIEREKKGNLMAGDNGDIIFIFNDKNDNNVKTFSLIEPLNKYIKKEAEMNNLYGEELDKKVFGKIFWLSSEKIDIK